MGTFYEGLRAFLRTKVTVENLQLGNLHGGTAASRTTVEEIPENPLGCDHPPRHSSDTPLIVLK